VERDVPRSSVIKTLAKVMIATGWVDGGISNEELNSLKDVLFQLPEMTASVWAELEIYLDSPIGEAERTRLVADLLDVLQNSNDKAMALSAIDAMVKADGKLTEKEIAVAQEVKSVIQEANVGVFGRLGSLLVDRRTETFANAPNRELYLDDYEKNKIFYSISRRLELDENSIAISEKELRKLSLAGGLMARVAYVDREVNEGEFDSMVAAIQKHWGLSDVEAALVAEVAVSEISKELDYYRLSRGFFEKTTEQERVHFLDALFMVANGDGYVSNLETEEIRTISKVLKLTHKQFIDAKLKIPSEQRAN
jgi:uncharacterized tellurite resistance protein B-like protein